jgi:branched-chain amino acid transport system permease protein
MTAAVSAPARSRNPFAGMDRKRRDTVIVVLLFVLAIVYPLIYPTFLQRGPLSFIPWPPTSVLIQCCVFGILALGLNIVMGFAGLLDLGYVAFYAIGAYTTAFLASPHFGIHISWWIVVWIAVASAAVFGILLGAPTLKLRGDYLAIVTLGFGEIVPIVFRNLGDFTLALPAFLGGAILIGPNANLTGGNVGINPIDPPTLPLPGGGEIIFSNQNLVASMYLIVALLALTFFICIRLRDSKLGRAWMAIREDETAAAAMGIPLMKTKTWSYAIGAFFGGVAGAFYASFKSGAFPADFYFNISVFLLCMVILGGMGSLAGVILGGMILGYLNIEGLATIGSKIQEGGLDFDPTKYQFGIYGVIIVLMMLFRPTGLIPERRHKIEMAEGVHDTPMYDVTHEGSLTDRNPSDD